MQHDEILFIEGKKKSKILLLDGYAYTLRNIQASKASWRCRLRSCQGRLSICEGIPELINDHNHLQNFDKNEAEYLLFQAKRRALLTNERARDIVSAEIGNIPVAVALHLPSIKSIGDALTKQRRLNNTGPVGIDDIPEIIKNTTAGEKFLQFDSGIENDNRVLIFTTKTNLLHLEHSPIWYADGTFKSCPSLFEQIYTIMAHIKGKNFPLCYILMKRRSKIAYIEAFNFIKNNIKTSPGHISIDFEMASFVAFREVFPTAKLLGCFFHLSQILYRKVQQSGLTKLYKSNSSFREAFKMILALSAVPFEAFTTKVREMDFYIHDKEDIKDIIPIWNYFKDSYCKNEDYGRGEASSIFSYHFWSILSRIENNMPKTTNSLEGWHRSLNANFCQAHPSVYEMGIELRKQQNIVMTKISHLFYTEEPSNQVLYYEEFAEVLEKYEEFYGILYLKKIALLLKIKI